MNAAPTATVIGNISTAGEIDNVVFNAGNKIDDIADIHAMGLGVDHNNKPSPENVPTPKSREEDAIYMAYQS